MSYVGSISRSPRSAPPRGARPLPAKASVALADHTVDRAPSRPACRGRRTSVLSACGYFSCCSLLAVASAVSTLSIGSVLSVLSVASTFSILSVASVESVFSIGSYGCYGKFFSNCHRANWDGDVSMDIRFAADVWSNMSRCGFDDYQRFKRFETTDNDCDYHRATCTYANRRGAAAPRTVPCTARRKGFSTFRDMDQRPSWKVKFYEDKEHASNLDLPLGDLGQVAGVKADKVLFNNMAYSTSFTGYGEVEAYDAYHRMAYPGMPAAAHVRIRSYRGNTLVNSYVGSIVEVVDNDDYFKRVDEYGSDRLLVEVGNTGLEYKDAEGQFKESIDQKLFDTLSNLKEEEGDSGGPLSMMSRDEVAKFYAGERLTHNWDGACLRPVPNNFYIVVWRTNGTTHMRFLPKGMDWVFQGCVYDWFAGSGAFCGPVQRLQHENASGFQGIVDAHVADMPYRSQTCAEEVGLSIAFAVSALGAACLATAGAVFVRRRWGKVSS